MVDSPDRHSGDPADWLPRLEELAYDAGRPLAVVATVTALPAGLDRTRRRDRQRRHAAPATDRPATSRPRADTTPNSTPNPATETEDAK